MSLLQQKIFEYIDKVGEKEAAQTFEEGVNAIRRWRAGSNKPSFDKVSLFYERVLHSQTPVVLEEKKVEVAPESPISTTSINSGLTVPENIDNIREYMLSKRDQLDSKFLNAIRDILFNWEGKNLMILCPWYKTTNPATAWTIAALAKQLGDKLALDMNCGDSIIVNSRNKLADVFLKNGAEWSLWLDDDVIAPVGKGRWMKEICNIRSDSFSEEIANRHLVERLMSHGKTLVGGVYFGRRQGSPPMFHEGILDAGVRDKARRMENRLVETEWVATGCLLVHRSVYQDIQKKFIELAPNERRPYWDFFRMKGDDGEDVAFCKRAKEAGHQPHADLGCVCGHVGNFVYGAWNQV